jgi:hypothetical protein
MLKSVCALFTGFWGYMWHSPFLLVEYGPFVVLVFILDMNFKKSYITQIKGKSPQVD